MDKLHAAARVVLITGVESTSEVLSKYNPSVYFAQAIGHWIFWPVQFDDAAPRNGAPWDEQCLPGELMMRMKAADLPDTGVIELNHPWAEQDGGRDLGWPRAIGMNFHDPLPRVDDGTGPGLFAATPLGSFFSNSDYHAQEVMNGTSNDHFLPYRAFWFYLLDQGEPRAGTANSDSHSLFDDLVATPRNIVFTSTTKAAFDQPTFNADVRAGHILGTNGPIITTTVTSAADHDTHSPGMTSFAPAGDAVLHIDVKAAPWVGVHEVRVIVNGEVARAFHDDVLAQPTDVFGTQGLARLHVDIPLAELLPSDRKDAWVVLEAGDPLPLAGDLDCNGAPDTGDNNGDGVVDFRDVDRTGDGIVNAADAIAGPEACIRDPGSAPGRNAPVVGPLTNGPPPRDDDDAFPFFVVTPGGYPLAFTNPYLLDRDGGGYQGPRHAGG
jgi:hypothetical protein